MARVIGTHFLIEPYDIEMFAVVCLDPKLIT